LRLGAFQLLHLDRIPARAAIDESVELASRRGQRFASGMVNAVLRKLNAAPRVQLLEETEEELALSTRHPPVDGCSAGSSFMAWRTVKAIAAMGQEPACAHGADCEAPLWMRSYG